MKRRCLKYSNIKRETTHSHSFWKKGEEGRRRGMGHRETEGGVTREGGDDRDRGDNREQRTENRDR